MIFLYLSIIHRNSPRYYSSPAAIFTVHSRYIVMNLWIVLTFRNATVASNVKRTCAFHIYVYVHWICAPHFSWQGYDDDDVPMNLRTPRIKKSARVVRNFSFKLRLPALCVALLKCRHTGQLKRENCRNKVSRVITNPPSPLPVHWMAKYRMCIVGAVVLYRMES